MGQVITGDVANTPITNEVDEALNDAARLVPLLADVVKDPSETYSFAREQPEIVDSLRAHLERGQKTYSSTVLPNMWNR